MRDEEEVQSPVQRQALFVSLELLLQDEFFCFYFLREPLSCSIPTWLVGHKMSHMILELLSHGREQRKDCGLDRFNRLVTHIERMVDCTFGRAYPVPFLLVLLHVSSHQKPCPPLQRKSRFRLNRSRGTWRRFRATVLH